MIGYQVIKLSSSCKYSVLEMSKSRELRCNSTKKSTRWQERGQDGSHVFMCVDRVSGGLIETLRC